MKNTLKESKGVSNSMQFINKNQINMGNLGNKTLELLESTGLNWTVRKVPLVTAPEPNQFWEPVRTGSFGIIKDDNKWLGTVGRSYQPIQNAELVDIFSAATEKLGLSISHGGMFGGGKKVFFQVELSETTIGAAGLKRWLTIMNCHDGSGSVKLGNTNKVGGCENVFYHAFSKDLSFRHGMTTIEKITKAAAELEVSLLNEKVQISNFEKMSVVPMTDESRDAVIKACFKVDVDAKASSVSKRTVAKTANILQAIDEEIMIHGNTLWALFNGITRYTNHVTKSKDRVASLMSGAGFETNKAAYKTILQFI